MVCIKCGREIPEGELFCPECANHKAKSAPKAPVTGQSPAQTNVKSAGTAGAPKASPSGSRTPNAPAGEAKKGKVSVGLLLALIAVSILLVAAVVYMIVHQKDVNRTIAGYRAREANLLAEENEKSSLESELEASEKEIEDLQLQLEDRDAQISELKNSLHSQEVTSSQSEYDKNAAQNKIDELEKENGDLKGKNLQLSEEVDKLTEENEKLAEGGEKLEETEKTLEETETQLKAVKEELDAAKEKADFLDGFIVFVNNDGSSLYHKYDCSLFSRSNFWAYSRKLAESNGFTPCPDCCQ